jgi:hypothetical protein
MLSTVRARHRVQTDSQDAGSTITPAGYSVLIAVPARRSIHRERAMTPRRNGAKKIVGVNKTAPRDNS